ncbi:MAG: ATP-binding protein [Treponema sp.]|jgi:predicted AAA+ superfamily ATPase|nr:ATP-binding protein [Treponema sp.]
MKLSELRDITRSQKERLEALDTGLERELLPFLPDIRSHALIVSGIRRCGKSTLLRQFVRKTGRAYFYCIFDDLRLYEFSGADYQLLDLLIAESGCGLLFFDEIQSAPRWELYIRQKLDEGFQVLLTGSNASLLSRELGNKLTGRHLSKELFPFSYREYLRFTGQAADAQSLDAYFVQGGFPEYLKTGNADIVAQLQRDILYRDIAVRYGIRDAAPLQRLYGFLVSNTAHLVSPSRLTAQAGVKSPSTVLEYFSWFQAAYLIRLVPCFAWSVRAQSLAPKKLYIADMGIIRTGSRSFTPDYGALMENFVFNQLRLSGGDVYYFSDNNRECDFIVNPGGLETQGPEGGAFCVQACYELNGDNQDREIAGLRAAMDFFNTSEGIIITRDTRDLILESGRKITVLPAWDWAMGQK